MSKKKETAKKAKTTVQPGFLFVKQAQGFSEYRLKSNGLTVLHHRIPNTGIVTTNLIYRVGSRDEGPGETGLAHMLEHMLFKPTKADLMKKIDSGAMQLERETGCILNASTWKDRTTYYFSYPKEYTKRALRVEADRMDGLVISTKEFQPEQGNVLSEFDMYNGNPYFALEAEMAGTAFHVHPYGHETIGYRSDIEQYTTVKLKSFYRQFYRPDNAVLMIFGDIEVGEALQLVRSAFGQKKNPRVSLRRCYPQEPKQGGLRRVYVERPSSTNLIALSVKHAGFPQQDWYTADALLSVLAHGPESILHKKLVDTGKATSVEAMIEPASDPSLGIIYLTVPPGGNLAQLEAEALKIITELKVADIKALLQKQIALELTDLLFNRGSSFSLAMAFTELVSAGDWEEYLQIEKKLKAVTAKSVLRARDQLFSKTNLTIGHFIGTA